MQLITTDLELQVALKLPQELYVESFMGWILMAEHTTTES